MEEFTLNLLIGGLIILLSIAVSAIFDYRKECHTKHNENNNEVVKEEEVMPDEPNQSQL